MVMANKELLEHVNWSQAICAIGGPRWRGERKSWGRSQQPSTLDLLGGGSKVGHTNKNRVRHQKHMGTCVLPVARQRP